MMSPGIFRVLGYKKNIIVINIVQIKARGAFFDQYILPPNKKI